MTEITLHNRDGYNMKLVQTEEDKWLFDLGNFPEWGGIQITGSANDIKMIDPTPGGPCISVGGIIKVYETGKIKTIKEIREVNGAYIITTEDRENGTTD